MHNPEKIVIYNCLFYVLERYFCSYMFFYSRQKEKKEQIKQMVREREMEYYAIATTEGIITDEERAWVDENTDKKVFEREVDVYAKIKVKSDPASWFEGKAGLYRKSGVILLVKRYAAIAAVVALAIVVAIYTTQEEEFSMEDIPMTVVKTETLPLPQASEPDETGVCYALLCLLYGKYEGKLILEPDFEHELLEGEIRCKGRIRLINLIYYGISFYRNKKLKEFITLIQNL